MGHYLTLEEAKAMGIRNGAIIFTPDDDREWFFCTDREFEEHNAKQTRSEAADIFQEISEVHAEGTIEGLS